MLSSNDVRSRVLSFRWWFMELFFVCAILLRWVPIFLRKVYFAQFCLHQCRSRPRLSYVFKILSVDLYVRNRIKHVHPVSDGNSRCRLGAARHSTNVSCLADPVCISSYRPTQDERARFSMTSSNGNISALLVLCAVNSSVTGEFPAQRPVTRSFDVFLELRPNKRLS